MNGLEAINSLVKKIEEKLATAGFAMLSVPKLLELMDSFYIFPPKLGYTQNERLKMFAAWCHAIHCVVSDNAMFMYRGNVLTMSLSATVNALFEDVNSEMEDILALCRLGKAVYFQLPKDEKWLESALDRLLAKGLAVEHAAGWMLTEEGEKAVRIAFIKICEEEQEERSKTQTPSK